MHVQINTLSQNKETVEVIAEEFFASVPRGEETTKLYDIAGNVVVSVEEDPVLHQEAEQHAQVARTLEEAACTPNDPRRVTDHADTFFEPAATTAALVDGRVVFTTTLDLPEGILTPVLSDEENDVLEAIIRDKDDGRAISDDDAMDSLAEEGGLVSLMGVSEIQDILEELEDTGADSAIEDRHDRVVTTAGFILVARELRGIRRALEKLVERGV
jgi:hypothetical protein